MTERHKRSFGGRVLLVSSSLLAAGLTVDVVSRVYDRLRPAPNGVRSLYAAAPARGLSRLWGRVAEARVPEVLRAPLFGAYAWKYGVIEEEMSRPSLRDYESFQDFFTRSLRPGVRSISPSGLACPVDGKVMACGPVDRVSGLLPTVKDFRYRLDEFVGSDWSRLQRSPGTGETGLFQVVLYLAPGDYHGFHAPAHMSITERRHFSGLLLPVAPWMLAACPSLFEANERVVLLGKYDGKYAIAYTAVGATNVGSVTMKFDTPLLTNSSKDVLGAKHFRTFTTPVELKRGEEVGFFRMGSTIVMVFEAKKGFSFEVQPGDKVKLGQRLGN